jgi:hypothetical protein
MSLMHILLNSIDADMKSEIGNSRGGLRPYLFKFHVQEAGADTKLNQHGPLGVAYHHTHYSTHHGARSSFSLFYNLRFFCFLFCANVTENNQQQMKFLDIIFMDYFIHKDFAIYVF